MNSGLPIHETRPSTVILSPSNSLDSRKFVLRIDTLENGGVL